jgi:hypothetical protein
MAIPTRQILILSRQSSVITYVLRADVPVGQEAAYATPGAVSPTGNVSDPDLAGLVAGTIAQTSAQLDLPQQSGETGSAYKTRAQAALVAQQAAYQSRVTAATPQSFFGAFWNGTSWANSGG